MTSIDNPNRTGDDPYRTQGPGPPDGPGGPAEPGGPAARHAAGRTGEVTAQARAVTEAALFEAFGGVRGMIETTVPGLIFVAVYTVNRDIKSSAIASLALSVIMGVARLTRRDTLKHALSGVFGVAFGAVFAMMSGNAKNFYLPGMLYTFGLAIAYLVSAAVKFPLLGLILGPVFKENLSWRKRNPGRLRAYTKASWAWGLILLAKSAILFPLYWWGDATQLGWVKVALGIPPFLLSVYLTWIFLVKAPPPIDVIAEMEAEEKAKKEHGEKQDAERSAEEAQTSAPS